MRKIYFSIGISKKQVEELSKIAEKMKESRAALIRKAIDDFIRKAKLDLITEEVLN
jgi:predicted transcriptional regulator